MQYIWYNAQDNYFYENDSKHFDGLAINAHILAHNAKAFLALELELRKPFFILPDVHFLQLYSPQQFDNQKGGIRISWEKLRAYYPKVVSKILDEQRALSVNDLASKEALEEFVFKILDFQRSALAAPFQSLGRLLPENARLPRSSFLIAPYFYFGGVTDPWYNVAINACVTATALKGTDKMYGLIFCATSCLNPQEIATICSGFSRANLDGFLIWIDEFDESVASEEELAGMLDLVRTLSSYGKPVINLYGGYFSVMLKHFGLDGFGSGICVRDKMPARPPAPMGGPAGGPVPRYYVPQVHRKFVQEDARRLIGQLPILSCNCEICSSAQVLTMPNQLPAERAYLRRLMRRHFLRIRSQEVKAVNSEAPGQTIGNIQSAATLVSGPAATVYELYFLNRWHDVLSSNLAT
jgi:hypothetical protein